MESIDKEADIVKWYKDNGFEYTHKFTSKDIIDKIHNMLYKNVIPKIEKNLETHNTCIYGDELYLLNVMGKYFYTKQDYDNMEKYHKMAIDKDNIESMLDMGIFHDIYGKKNYSLTYFKQAADLGSTNGMMEYGKCLKHMARFDEAEYYFRKAIEFGESNGYIELCDSSDNPKNEKYLLKAVEMNNNTEAMIKLGTLYCYIKKDKAKMTKYYLMAFEYGNINGLLNLGQYYTDCHKYDKAEKYFQMMIDNGDINGYKHLANLELKKKNTDKMLDFLNKGLEHKDYFCAYLISKYYQKNKDTPNRIKYATLAAENNDINACLDLAKYYRTNGNNLKEALKYYMMSYTNYDLYAKSKIIELMDTNNDVFHEFATMVTDKQQNKLKTELNEISKKFDFIIDKMVDKQDKTN